MRLCPPCCRYLRPGDSLPVGVPPTDVKPMALPEGWREKYAGTTAGLLGTRQSHTGHVTWHIYMYLCNLPHAELPIAITANSCKSVESAGAVNSTMHVHAVC
jgi:hypothetical protein